MKKVENSNQYSETFRDMVGTASGALLHYTEEVAKRVYPNIKDRQNFYSSAIQYMKNDGRMKRVIEKFSTGNDLLDHEKHMIEASVLEILSGAI